MRKISDLKIIQSVETPGIPPYVCLKGSKLNTILHLYTAAPSRQQQSEIKISKNLSSPLEQVNRDICGDKYRTVNVVVLIATDI